MFNLFMKSNKKRAKRRGFTLIELVIVIVILGVLAGVAALSFQNVTKSSKEGVAKANLRALKSAVQVYQVDHNGELPAAADYSITPAGSSAAVTIKGVKPIAKYVEDATLTSPVGYTYSMTSTGTAPNVTEVVLKVTDGASTEPFVETITIKLK